MLTAAETVLYNTSSTGPIRKFLTVIAPAVGRLGILLDRVIGEAESLEWNDKFCDPAFAVAADLDVPHAVPVDIRKLAVVLKLLVAPGACRVHPETERRAPIVQRVELNTQHIGLSEVEI